MRIGLYPNNSDDIFEITLKRKYFIKYCINLKEDEGFYFWIKKTDLREVIKMSPLPENELTPEDLRQINERIREILD